MVIFTHKHAYNCIKCHLCLHKQIEGNRKKAEYNDDAFSSGRVEGVWVWYLIIYHHYRISGMLKSEEKRSMILVGIDNYGKHNIIEVQPPIALFVCVNVCM